MAIWTEAEAMALLVMACPAYGVRRKALSAAGSALAVVSEPQRWAGQLTESGVKRLRQTLQRGEARLDALRGAGIALLIQGAPGYPSLLSRIAKPPHLLFVRGEPSLEDRLPIAMVGTRTATEYGLRHSRRIAQELAQAGACIVSGIALGVDAAAHRGALDGGGRTVAVLGSALDCFYPEENAPLMQEILESGGSVVTEYAPGIMPGRFTFLDRNRIIAGMSLGVIVTEGLARSGALRTAHDALEAEREVFALPGSVDNPMTALPHKLIAEGAHLASCAEDVLDVLREQHGVIAERIPSVMPKERKRQPAGADAQRGQQAKPAAPGIPEGLGDEERAVYAALMCGEADFDALCAATGVEPDALGAVLTMMEMDGMIEALPGLSYRLV
ncbi:MAG: DNA-processing protein DprA [Clostridia bacterium]|nr:DNA-processing protein DprA [Clostridia bacterium]